VERAYPAGTRPPEYVVVLWAARELRARNARLQMSVAEIGRSKITDCAGLRLVPGYFRSRGRSNPGDSSSGSMTPTTATRCRHRRKAALTRRCERRARLAGKPTRVSV
jgi:hypothetical protein